MDWQQQVQEMEGVRGECWGIWFLKAQLQLIYLKAPCRLIRRFRMVFKFLGFDFEGGNCDGRRSRRWLKSILISDSGWIITSKQSSNSIIHSEFQLLLRKWNCVTQQPPPPSRMWRNFRNGCWRPRTLCPAAAIMSSDYYSIGQTEPDVYTL